MRKAAKRPSAGPGGSLASAANTNRRRSEMSSFFTSQHMPCTECGASVHLRERGGHTCDPERRLEYHLFQLRDEVAGFDHGLGAYLDSPQGRFEQWLAERDRRATGT
jgi:hypothetical protein